MAEPEAGVLVGTGLFGFGAGYAGWLVFGWVSSGFAAIPFTLAFTAIVLGVQTVFSSFFMSAVTGDT